MNFSLSKDWGNSLILRYSPDQIIKIGNLSLIKDNNIYKCQNFFDFDISKSEYNELLNLLNGKNKIRFSYINDSVINKIILLSEENEMNIEYIDKWDAPILHLNTSPQEYFSNSKHSQIKRNYKKYKNEYNNYIYLNSTTTDILSLWNHVLNIDYNSWKKAENSDMKSLDREDLQYLSYMLKNPNDINLVVVCDLNEKPLAYSLMFKNSDGYWYAVKWGASYEGRKLYSGFYALFYHIEFLYKLQSTHLNLDFWGRRNETYDKLKNNSLSRNHIYLTKEKV